MTNTEREIYQTIMAKLIQIRDNEYLVRTSMEGTGAWQAHHCKLLGIEDCINAVSEIAAARQGI